MNQASEFLIYFFQVWKFLIAYKSCIPLNQFILTFQIKAILVFVVI